MEHQIAVYLQNAMMLTAKVSAPVLLASLSVGFLISIFQAVTQLQEQTLTFVPKIFAVFITLSISMMWMMNMVVDFAQQLLREIPSLIG